MILCLSLADCRQALPRREPLACGLEGLVPLLEEIKQSREAFNPENMTAMRNTVEELKSLMTEVRSLLDQEVNKPVVHGWLEEEQE